MTYLMKVVMHKLAKLFLLVQILNSAPVFDEIDSWEYIVNEEIKVGWVDIDNVYWCQSYSFINHSMEDISSVLIDRKNYANVFDRIVKSDIYDDIVHIKLDLPFPFASRDYIVKYTVVDNDSIIYYNWKYTDEINIPVSNKCVRLINAEGQWKLVGTSLGTHVYYRWNGELRGDFPNWALKRAWREQGKEVMIWLDAYLDSNE